MLITSPQVTYTSVQPGYQSEIPTTPSSVSIICYKDSQNSGKRFTYICGFIIKAIVRNTHEEADEEEHRVRFGRVLSSGTSLLV